MNQIEQIQKAFSQFISTQFSVNSLFATKGTFQLNVDPNKQQFGDLNANAPMILAKQLGRNPREIAQEIIDLFAHPLVTKLEIAGPGFLNAFLSLEGVQALAQELITAKELFFCLGKNNQKNNYNIEFVSANPTGPLHLGHGRGGILGDVLGNILKFIGHTVTQEYYINDAGNQIKKLGNSLFIRCQQELGQTVELPENAYRGDYLIDLAKQCVSEHGKTVLEKNLSFFEEYAKDLLLTKIKETLQQYGIEYDVWFSEKTLHQSNAIEQSIDTLKQNEHMYEKENALWFASTQFGDDKDRVVRKASGDWTYVAADIAYMQDKVARGAKHLIMVLGHDHHSYAVRLETVRQALKLNISLDVILYQLVKMKSEGKQLKMSKRSGTMITLNDVIETVGTDVARFFYLHRRADAQLEFDLDLALKKTDENPVYYAQYAYVRTKSILEKAAAQKELQNIEITDITSIGPEEALLLKKIASLKSLLATISKNFQTHLLTYYIIELADLFHRYYSKHRVIELANIKKSRARLLLIELLQKTFATTFKLIGISTPEKM